MSAPDLCTLADVKAWLGPAMGVTDDGVLTRLITAASSAMQTWMNRPIGSASYTETRNGNGGSQLTLWNGPIVAVSSLVIDGVTIAAAAAPFATHTGYAFDGTTVYLNGYRFTRGLQNVVVTYTAGFATVPTELAQACIELVVHRYRERERIGMSSKAIAGETTQFTVTDFPKSTLAMMNNYKRVIQVA